MMKMKAKMQVNTEADTKMKLVAGVMLMLLVDSSECNNGVATCMLGPNAI